MWPQNSVQITQQTAETHSNSISNMLQSMSRQF